MATHVIGAVTATFGALIEGVSDRAGPLRELNIGIHWVSEAEFNNLMSLVNYDTEVVPMPWGTTVEVLIKGGPGIGTLTIAGLGVFQAYLTECEKSQVIGTHGHLKGRAKFLIAG